jgi:hypothetical protein
MRRFLRDAGCLLLACLLVTPVLAADAAPPDMRPGPRFREPKPLDWGISKPLADNACLKPKYLEKIVNRFNWVQEKTWETNIRMIGIHDPREIDFKLNGPETMVDKVYCRASAEIVDLSSPDLPPKTHMVAFIVEEDGGFVGVVPGIEWCVAGYDWFREYEPSCRVLNPH